MNFCRRRFNLYLLPAAIWLLVTGCAHFHHKKDPVGILRVHIESESSAAGSTKTVSVLRSEPVMVNIATDPILTEADVVAARLLDAPGGFALEIKFDNMGTWRLEQYTAINPGKHLVIFGQWSDKVADGRWLAAPLITHRIGGGVLTFTPDASHAEAAQLVAGLNFEAKKNADSKPTQ